MNNLLIKIPTRERGADWLSHYVDNVTNPNTKIVMTLDYNDPTIRDSYKWKKHGVGIVVGESKSKIDAYNRDIGFLSQKFDWDVIMVGSDDMWPNTRGFDQIILDDMAQHFPDGDGCLWYDTEDSKTELKRRYPHRSMPFGSEAWKQHWINMLPVIGRKYYDRFGYIYHPSYKSFWCDNEFTHIANRLGKIQPIDRDFIRHQHFCWDGGMPNDSLYQRNNKNDAADHQNFNRRRGNNFNH
jgi:hypothetical protein